MRIPAPGCVPPNTVTPAARPFSRSPTFVIGRVSTSSAAATCAMALPTSRRRCAPVAVETTALSEAGTEVSVMSSVTVCPAATVTVCRASPYPTRSTRTVMLPAGTPRNVYWPSPVVMVPVVVPTILIWADPTGCPLAPSVIRPEMVPVLVAWPATSGGNQSDQSASRSAGARRRSRDMGRATEVETAYETHRGGEPDGSGAASIV